MVVTAGIALLLDSLTTVSLLRRGTASRLWAALAGVITSPFS